MAKKSRKKHLYWHDIAKNLLEMGLKAGEVAKCLKSIFPSAEITGRHVGGYRRRLINDDMLETQVPKIINMQEALSMTRGWLSEDDEFIYHCAVGSAKRQLKCFEYKMTEEIKDRSEELDIWLMSVGQ